MGITILPNEIGDGYQVFQDDGSFVWEIHEAPDGSGWAVSGYYFLSSTLRWSSAKEVATWVCRVGRDKLERRFRELAARSAADAANHPSDKDSRCDLIDGSIHMTDSNTPDITAEQLARHIYDRCFSTDQRVSHDAHSASIPLGPQETVQLRHCAEKEIRFGVGYWGPLQSVTGFPQVEGSFETDDAVVCWSLIVGPDGIGIFTVGATPRQHPPFYAITWTTASIHVMQAAYWYLVAGPAETEHAAVDCALAEIGEIGVDSYLQQERDHLIIVAEAALIHYGIDINFVCNGQQRSWYVSKHTPAQRPSYDI